MTYDQLVLQVSKLDNRYKHLPERMRDKTIAQDLLLTKTEIRELRGTKDLLDFNKTTD